MFIYFTYKKYTILNMPIMILSSYQEKKLRAWTNPTKTKEAVYIKTKQVDTKAKEAEDTKASEVILREEEYRMLVTKLNTYFNACERVEGLSKKIEKVTKKINKTSESIKYIKSLDVLVNTLSPYMNPYINTYINPPMNMLEIEKESYKPYIESYTNAQLNAIEVRNQAYMAYIEAFNEWNKLI